MADSSSTDSSTAQNGLTQCRVQISEEERDLLFEFMALAGMSLDLETFSLHSENENEISRLGLDTVVVSLGRLQPCLDTAPEGGSNEVAEPPSSSEDTPPVGAAQAMWPEDDDELHALYLEYMREDSEDSEDS
ncbi:hypothetical protein HYPSUDRAFT_868910 [Hypholoma sublateritium FD-334 SS-4]|uniref:Uncharacterized protein n=1 Tax=Hypholoma sublateritium (strain FD-334 SS-4) TaxID=945553 RepID=A0A0D2Q7M6_HYPSF|nr:hypothetical protein HYPSUDRAFT_868910 [Hypholoma sublateritium FD-334 SS-4]